MTSSLPPRWGQSRAAYYADFVLFPLMILATAGYSFRHWWTIPLVTTGLVLWTLAEYLIHRYLFHGPLSASHEEHHAEPEAFVGIGSRWTAFLYLGLLALMPSEIGAGLLVGLALGYVLYIVVHDRIHHGRIGPHSLRWLRRAKLRHSWHHHVDDHSGYGVVTGFWDRMRGTSNELFE